jgi:hypothetical protein
MYYKEKYQVKLHEGEFAEAEARKYAFLDSVEIPNSKGFKLSEEVDDASILIPLVHKYVLE